MSKLSLTKPTGNVWCRAQSVGYIYTLANQAPRPTPAPSYSTKLPGVKLATFNMQDGRNSRLLSRPQPRLENQDINICFATETRIPNAIQTHHACGYNIVCSFTTTRNQGGIALLCWKCPNWHIESTKRHDPNMISTMLGRLRPTTYTPCWRLPATITFGQPSISP